MSIQLLLLLRNCDACGMAEERVFIDSWSGKQLCSTCLHAIIGRLTLSPASEGDNLDKLWGELTT